jgi:chemotaxis protein MotB
MLRSIITQFCHELGAPLRSKPATAETRKAELAALRDQLRDLIEAGTVHAAIIDKQLVLQLCADAAFEPQTADLTPVGQDALRAIADALSHFPNHRFEVDGHTDIGSPRAPQFRTNWSLAAARASSAVRALREAGLAERALSSLSYGEFHPTATNDTAEGRAENRRIEILVLPDSSLSSAPS